MSACNQIEISDYFHPVEILNEYMENQNDYWETNQIDIPEDEHKILHSDDIWVQQNIQDLAQNQNCSSYNYQALAVQQNIEGSSNVSQYTLNNNYQYENDSNQIHFPSHWPYTRNTLTTTPHRYLENSCQKYSYIHNTNHRTKIYPVPMSSGTLKAIIKRKRKRTNFTTEQVKVLEDVFSKKPYISRDDRQILVHQLQLSDKSVKIWFQNRRLKGKRQNHETYDDNMSEDNEFPDVDSLNYVESEIKKKTDQFGYVTLDNAVISNLVSVIDTCLTRSSDIEVISTTDAMDNGSNPIYEPISPASSDDSDEKTNYAKWEPFEPIESFQRLLDIQSLITV